MPSPLQLTLFGSPEVRLHGQPVTGFRTGKAQALLYYLAVTGRPHTRATLAGLLWGDQPEDAARASLSKCLSNLRDLLSDALLIERQTVAFNQSYPYDLDTERFAAVGQPLTVATSQALQAALALYRGDLLEGFYVREAPDFEQWLLLQRAHYREAAINGLHALAGFHEQGGDLPSAITYTRRLLALEPWREEAHRQLMTLLARSGQRAAALAQFDVCRQTLAEELAVDPAAETVALLAQIKRNALENSSTHPANATFSSVPAAFAQAAHRVMNNLPIPISSFIGRQRELREVQTLLTTKAGKPRVVGGVPPTTPQEWPAIKLVTLSGIGGSGKTRLAIQVATDLLSAYQDGVWWVDLAPLLDDDRLVPQVLAKVLGVSERLDQSVTDTLIDNLVTKQMLLVFDNCERLIDACAQLTLRLLNRCPALQILATSREPLGILGERVYQAPTLELPVPGTALSVELLLRYAAIQLFVERGQAIMADFCLTQANGGSIRQICHQLDGIPLAIELAAARLRVLTVDQIAARLSDRLNLLTAGSRTAPPHHQTLRITLDWSYDLLTNEERLLFRRLAIFAGSFPIEAIEAICGPLFVPILDTLMRLVEKSLVLVEQTEQGVYYRLLEIVRDYAREKLLASGEIDLLRLRHLHFFIHLAEAADEQLQQGQQERWLAWFERHHDNIRIALRRATESGKTVEAFRLAASMGLFWELHGYWQEGRHWLAQVLRLHEETETPGDAALKLRSWTSHAFMRAGSMAWRQCDFAGAHTLLEKSLALFSTLNEQEGIHNVLVLLGGVAFEQGDYATAETYYGESLRVARTFSKKHAVGMTLFGLGLTAYHTGNYPLAQVHLTESLTVFRASGHSDVNYPLNALGNLANLQGDYATAHVFYAEALAWRRTLGDKRGIAAILSDVANVTLKQGNVSTAQTHYRESLLLFQELGNQRGIVGTISGLARLCQGQGDHELAAQLLAAVATLLQSLPARLDEPEFSDSQRAVVLLRTQLDEATFQSAWHKGQQMTLEQTVALALQSIANLGI